MQVKETKNADDFVLLGTNRELHRPHVEALKKATEETGNITAIQPVLVNERMEVIDGQHRLQANKELEMPIHYIQIKGLRIQEARNMNIGQKGWSPLDFAKSYAEEGNESYQRFLEVRESFPEYSHTATLLAAEAAGVPKSRRSNHTVFREGEFTMSEETKQKTMEILEQVKDYEKLLPFTVNKTVMTAILRVMSSKNYDHKRMVEKLKDYDPANLRAYSDQEDNMFQLEKVFNRNNHTSTRLF